MCLDRASVQFDIQGLLTEVALHEGVLCIREVRFRALTILWPPRSRLFRG